MHNASNAGVGRSLSFLTVATVLALAGSAQSAGVAGRHAGADGAAAGAADVGLPFFDIRLDGDELPTGAVRAALERVKARHADAGQRAARIASLSERIPGLVVDDHELFGTPAFVRSTRSFLTGTHLKASAKDVVRGFLEDNRGLFEISAGEVDSARVDRELLTEHNGAVHLTLQQQIRGVDLFGCMIKASVTAKGELINISSSVLTRPEGDFATPEVKVSDVEAIALAALNVGIVMTEIPAAAGEPEGASLKRSWLATEDFRPEEPVVTEMVYFPMTSEIIHPAWSVVIPQKGIGHTYEMIVDATDGAVLWRHNRLVFETTQPISFRVYSASDSPAPLSPSLASPTGFQAPFVAREFVTVTPAQVSAFSINGWIDDGGTETLGNNVDAHLDLNADNAADLPRPNGGAGRVFDFPLDTNQAPSTYQNASVTELFYRANLYHDRLYAMGFNEAARNFQTNNFGRGGTGNDAVQADAQDGSGTNNANFNTGGADGSSARVQMYIFTGPTPDRDGSLDGDIVYHELSHGLSIRLHGGLSGTAQGGQGEGWSDFFGICLLAQATDDPDANYTTGGYATRDLGGAFTDNYYFGIRRYPYSTSFGVNPMTFADTDPGQISLPATGVVPRSPVIGTTANEVHNLGEIWCNTLLECRAGLWRQYGFAGNQLMMQLVVDGMKLAPANPNFLQSRDAIIQADQVNNGGANFTTLWNAFAKRGMGLSATAPASSTTGVVEAFNTPQFVTFAYPDGLPTRPQPGAESSFRVEVTGTNLSITGGSGTLHYSVNGGAFATALMEETSTGRYVATLPAELCGTSVAYYVSVSTSAGVRTDPATAPTGANSALVTGPETVIFSDDFETDQGWTVGPTTATSGAWVRVDPLGTAVAPGDDHTPGAGTRCWVTGQGTGGGVGEADVDNGLTTLVSPTINASGFADATVSYWRWYSTGGGASPYLDTFRVDVSNNNGATWVNAETVGPGSASDPNTNPGWIFHSFTFSQAHVAPTAQMRVRFVAEDAAPGSVVEAAIDDFSVIFTAACINPPTCRADFNGDGVLDPDDLSDYIGGFFAAPPDVRADFNGDGVVDPDDLSDYIGSFFAGC